MLFWCVFHFNLLWIRIFAFTSFTTPFTVVHRYLSYSTAAHTDTIPLGHCAQFFQEIHMVIDWVCYPGWGWLRLILIQKTVSRLLQVHSLCVGGNHTKHRKQLSFFGKMQCLSCRFNLDHMPIISIFAWWSLLTYLVNTFFFLANLKTLHQSFLPLYLYLLTDSWRSLIIDTLISSASLISSSDSVISMGCFISSRVDWKFRSTFSKTFNCSSIYSILLRWVIDITETVTNKMTPLKNLSCHSNEAYSRRTEADGSNSSLGHYTVWFSRIQSRQPRKTIIRISILAVLSFRTTQMHSTAMHKGDCRALNSYLPEQRHMKNLSSRSNYFFPAISSLKSFPPLVHVGILSE